MADSHNKTSLRPQRRFIRLWVPGIIRNDFWRKLIALFFALLIYFMVSSRIGTDIRIDNVPVSITIPAKLVNMNHQIPKVTVGVLGSKRQLNKLTASDIKISATVIENKFTPGIPYSLKLTDDNVTTPFGVKIVKIEPQEIILTMEKVETRQVAVKADFDSNKMPEDYIVGKVNVSPAEVWIRGAGSLIQNIKYIETAPVPLEYQTESFEYSASIPKNSNYNVSPQKVTVNVEIAKYLASRTIKAIPIKILESSNDADDMDVELLSTPHVDVTINGSRGKIVALKQDMIKPYVDISSLEDPGTYKVTVDCWVNLGGVKITNVFPKQITIKLSPHSPGK
jgi:YbbR domain-containing protein